MAKIFLDANYFIDLVEKRKKIDINHFQNFSLYISPLSVHIFVYVYKYKIPNKNLQEITRYFSLAPLNETVIQRSFLGPTGDFEDNLQLHSSALAECSIFLTRDLSLLKIGYFGSVKIQSAINNKLSPI